MLKMSMNLLNWTLFIGRNPGKNWGGGGGGGGGGGAGTRGVSVVVQNLFWFKNFQTSLIYFPLSWILVTNIVQKGNKN